MNKTTLFECYNAIPFGVCVFDKHLKIQFANHVFQCTLENNYITKDQTELNKIFPIFNDEYFKLRLEMLFQFKTPIFLSSVLHNSLHIKEGASYNLSFFPHHNQENNEIYAILTIEEVTDLMNQIKLQETLLTKLDIELKKTKEAKAMLLESETLLREANEAKNNLFSIIAHDLKSPFNALLGITDLLSMTQCKQRTCQMESLHIAMGIAAKQGLDLVTNLLSWAQTQSNKIQAYPDQFQLDHAIEEVMAYYSTSALKKQIEMTITRTGDNLSVFADPDMIKIVIQNLISNAIKFTSSGGRIDIIIEDLGKEKLVKIRDNGIGMPPALVKKLNNNLKLGSRNGTELEKGTGLGIMICKDLIKRNKGRLILSSKEDEGTVASLFL